MSRLLYKASSKPEYQSRRFLIRFSNVDDVLQSDGCIIVYAEHETPAPRTIVEQDAVLVSCGLRSKSLESARNHNFTPTRMINATVCAILVQFIDLLHGVINVASSLRVRPRLIEVR
jgi:hypothetical protein